ncbi:MAG TPA: glycosyltransferase family 2 protein [Candidatus Angelobacter sp.]|nr:glycosyltransferase family 2 protein [Candidatus Angelobacter sp.]
MIWFYWITGVLLAAIWLAPVLQLVLHFSEVADLTQPQWIPAQDVSLPSLTIIVPARNEEAEIEPALCSLLRLNYPHYEVIAVNDRSSDQTGQIMERLAAEYSSAAAAQGRLRVLHVRELPPQWLGKVHAMWLGAQQAGTEWLLFTDADCVFAPDALRRAVHYAESTGTDHLVLFPTAHMRTLGERMMIAFPQVMSGFAMRPWKARDPNARDHMGVGAFNLVRRQAYEAIGTYEKLRLEVVDDIKLGETIKKSGLRQDVTFGPGLVTLRWAVGAAGVVANLEKNLFAFLRFRILLVLLVCATTSFLCISPFAGLLLAPGWARPPFAVTIFLIAIAYAYAGRYMASSPWLFITCPIAAVIFAYATLQSAFIALRDGAITWRGTKYSLEELKKKSN